MTPDYGYPDPDAVTPEVQALVDADTEVQARKMADLLRGWERTFEALRACPGVLERLGDILNHTGCAEDGETIYVKVEDAAEVYAILFQAWTAGEEYLDDMVQNAEEGDGRTITQAQLHAVLSYDPETGGRYGKVRTPKSTKWVDVEISLT